MKIRHEFVEYIPETLEQGVIYISLRYRTASHLCMSGCNRKIVTPIRPERWHLEYDGKSISLSPSIGNWDLPCKSHYWIKNDTVEWSYQMSDDEIMQVKTEQAMRVKLYYQPHQKRWYSWLKKHKK